MWCSRKWVKCFRANSLKSVVLTKGIDIRGFLEAKPHFFLADEFEWVMTAIITELGQPPCQGITAYLWYQELVYVLEHWLWKWIYQWTSQAQYLSWESVPNFVKFFFFALIKVKSRDFLISSKDFVNQRRYKNYWPRLSKKLNLSKTVKLMLLCFVSPASFFCNILSSLTIFCSSHSLLFQYFVLMVFPQLHFQRLSSRKKNSKLFTPHCDVCNHKVSIHPLSSV